MKEMAAAAREASEKMRAERPPTSKEIEAKLTITGSKVEWLTTNFCPGGPRMKGGIRPGPPRIPLDRARLIFPLRLQRTTTDKLHVY